MEQTLEQQFRKPSDEFTPIPFWFWNDALTKEEIIRQIRSFAEKGVMGFVIHPRIGIPDSIPYLSDAYMDLVEAAVQEAAEQGMTVILYDEAMYPSGSAKGLVVQGNPEFASRGLKMAEFGCAEPIRLSSLLGEGDVLVSAQAVKKQGDRLADQVSTIILDTADGAIFYEPSGEPDEWAILLFIETYSRGTIRGIHFGEDDGEPDAPPSADLLNVQATRKFIRLTHERYYERLGKYFGSTIQAMFTDEPDILGRRHLKGLRPWTADFLECFIREGNAETDLPLLWLEGDSASSVRRTFRKAVQKQMVAAYYLPLSEWCAQHGIALTGHPAGSDDIGLLEHFQIPGQDVVWRWVAPEDGKGLEGKHSTAAKCSSDAARHRGRRRNINEFLGVCGKGAGWALTADDMKWYTDWLLVRGVNMLCPHAFYYSIDGPRRWGERPPDVGPNNIWWPHYNTFSAYMKRMSWLMTDSRNVTLVAVLCKEDSLPWRIVKPLYENQIEFNYLEESLLVSACSLEEGRLRIGEQAYTVLLVEDGAEFEEETRRALSRFRDNGGVVIGMQEDAFATAAVADADQVVSVLDQYMQRDVILDPPCSDIRVSHVVKDDHHFVVLVNEGERSYEGTITIGAVGLTELWDAWTGEIHPADAHRSEAGMHVHVALERRQSIVCRIDPSAQPVGTQKQAARRAARQTRVLLDGWRVSAPEFSLVPPGLGSWTEHRGLERTSGTAMYLNTFKLDALEEDSEVVLDLGEVHEIAEVRINGERAGVSMWHPYTMNIRPYVKQGENELTVAVTNSLANRIDGIGLPSGLIGPVKVTVI